MLMFAQGFRVTYTLTFGCRDSKDCCERDNDAPSIRVILWGWGTGQESTETEAVGAVLGLYKVLREKVKTALWCRAVVFIVPRCAKFLPTFPTG